MNILNDAYQLSAIYMIVIELNSPNDCSHIAYGDYLLFDCHANSQKNYCRTCQSGGWSALFNNNEIIFLIANDARRTKLFLKELVMGAYVDWIVPQQESFNAMSACTLRLKSNDSLAYCDIIKVIFYIRDLHF